jgi:hypothetical protein
MRGTYSFLNRGVGVKPMIVEVTTSPQIRVDKITPVALQDVDILDFQSFQAVLNPCEDMLERRSAVDKLTKEQEAGLPCGRVRGG